MSSSDLYNEDKSGEITLSKNEECTSEQNNNVDNITNASNNVAILDNTSICANCGKDGNSDDMNTCNKCKEVKYCNAACKKKHRKKHKKKCERRAAELFDEKLFKDPPPPEECPICMQPLPLDASQIQFKSCCGKMICNGCIYAMWMSEGKDLCAFCRTPPPSCNEDKIERTKNLMDKGGNAEAFLLLAGYYADGEIGLPQDWNKANELYLKAGELGCAAGYFNLGNQYCFGRGVEVDKMKAKYYYELAAMGGYADARHNLGCEEFDDGNEDRATRHFMLAARAGDNQSMGNVTVIFKKGMITKDEYEGTLRVYQKSLDEMKSDARQKATEIQKDLDNRGVT